MQRVKYRGNEAIRVELLSGERNNAACNSLGRAVVSLAFLGSPGFPGRGETKGKRGPLSSLMAPQGQGNICPSKQDREQKQGLQANTDFAQNRDQRFDLETLAEVVSYATTFS